MHIFSLLPHRPFRRRRKRPRKLNPTETMKLDDLPGNGRGFQTKVYNKVVTTTITDTPDNEKKHVVENIQLPKVRVRKPKVIKKVPEYDDYSAPVGNGYGREAVEEHGEDVLPVVRDGLYDRTPWKPYRPATGYGSGRDRPRYQYSGHGQVTNNQRQQPNYDTEYQYDSPQDPYG